MFVQVFYAFLRNKTDVPTITSLVKSRAVYIRPLAIQTGLAVFPDLCSFDAIVYESLLTAFFTRPLGEKLER
jgi:hypothetical protein